VQLRTQLPLLPRHGHGRRRLLPRRRPNGARGGGARLLPVHGAVAARRLFRLRQTQRIRCVHILFICKAKKIYPWHDLHAFLSLFCPSRGCFAAFQIHLLRIRIQHFRQNTHPDPGFWWQKKLKLKKKIFWSKTTIYLSIGLHNGRLSYKRSLQLSKENIHHFKTRNFFSSFVGHFCRPGSGSVSWSVTNEFGMRQNNL